MKVYTIIAAGLIGITALNSSAYTFTFKNHVDAQVTVAMQLVGIGEPHHTKVLSAKGETAFNFDGGRIWFCLDSNTVKVTKQGGAEVALPVAYISQRARDKFVSEMHATGKCSIGSANIPHRIPGVCRNQTFDIVADMDGKLRVTMVSELF